MDPICIGIASPHLDTREYCHIDKNATFTHQIGRSHETHVKGKIKSTKSPIKVLFG